MSLIILSILSDVTYCYSLKFELTDAHIFMPSWGIQLLCFRLQSKRSTDLLGMNHVSIHAVAYRFDKRAF